MASRRQRPASLDRRVQGRSSLHEQVASDDDYAAARERAALEAHKDAWRTATTRTRKKLIRAWCVREFERALGVPWQARWERWAERRPMVTGAKSSRSVQVRAAIVSLLDWKNVLGLPLVESPLGLVARFLSGYEYALFTLACGLWPKKLRLGYLPSDVLRVERGNMLRAMKDYGQKPFTSYEGEDEDTDRLRERYGSRFILRVQSVHHASMANGETKFVTWRMQRGKKPSD